MSQAALNILFWIAAGACGLRLCSMGRRRYPLCRYVTIGIGIGMALMLLVTLASWDLLFTSFELTLGSMIAATAGGALLPEVVSGAWHRTSGIARRGASKLGSVLAVGAVAFGGLYALGQSPELAEALIAFGLLFLVGRPAWRSISKWLKW